MRILVTGGAGFIGSNFIRHLLDARPDVGIVNFDALTYAGNLENLAECQSDARYSFVRGDVADASDVERCFARPIDALVHFAAESHVDRSILDAAAFIRTNVQGTHTLLEAARRNGVGRFVQVSTDEVYGSLGEKGFFSESSPLAPNSPYAASKAAADLLCRAYHETHRLDVVVTRCSNNYGPYQFPEKLIPLMILNALQDKRLPVYGDGLYTRDWIHVSDHCRGLEQVLLHGASGAVYNIGADQEVKNIDVVKRILALLGKPESLIEYVKDRPGHDRRYAVDAGFIRGSIGWTPLVRFDEGIERTVHWYANNDQWVRRVRSGDYLRYYDRMYTDREATFAEAGVASRDPNEAG